MPACFKHVLGLRKRRRISPITFVTLICLLYICMGLYWKFSQSRLTLEREAISELVLLERRAREVAGEAEVKTLSRLTTTSFSYQKSRKPRINDNPDCLGEGLNNHVWEGSCLRTHYIMCRFPLFPKAPNSREIVHKLALKSESSKFVQRVFGYVHPPETGEYTFLLVSYEWTELWLSTDGNWRNSRLIAAVGEKENSVLDSSLPIVLFQGQKYYIEALHIANGKKNFVEVQWNCPSSRIFRTLANQSISPFVNDTHLNILQKYDHQLPGCISCQNNLQQTSNKFMKPEVLPYLEHMAGVLPTCNYNPSYVVRGRKLKRFEAAYSLVFHTNSYPVPHLHGVTLENQHKNIFNKQQAERLTKLYIDKLEEKHPG